MFARFLNIAAITVVFLMSSTHTGLAQSAQPQATSSAALTVQEPVSLGTDAHVAQLAAKVQMLREQVKHSDEQRAIENERAATRGTWLVSLAAVFVAAILTLFGWFISSRMREPEEFRENMRARLDSELASARQAVHEAKQEASTVVQATLQTRQKELKDLFEAHREKLEELYTQAKAESEEFEKRNATTLQQLRDLIEIGAGEAPGEKPDADALYYMAERVTADDPKERRAKAVRYLRHLVDPSIAANAVVLHNAGVRAKEYDAQELAIDLFARAVRESGGSPEFESSYAHELALVRRADQAHALFRKLLDEHPNNESVGKRYIDAMRALKEHAKIDAYVETHEKLLGNSAMVICEYGDYLLDRRRLPEAEKVLQKALELDPADDLAWGYVGRLHMIKGDLAEAQRALEAAIRCSTEASPRLGGHFQRLGDVFVGMEKLELAEWAYKASLIADRVPGRAEKWLNIIEYKKKLPKSDGAPNNRPD